MHYVIGERASPNWLRLIRVRVSGHGRRHEGLTVAGGRRLPFAAM
jgi:hypothetical protein